MSEKEREKEKEKITFNTTIFSAFQTRADDGSLHEVVLQMLQET